jgi:SAM-dependent methyltransferase
VGGLLRDYGKQARTYDQTRSASPSVVGPLREALVAAPGRRVADIGGGTGNYALALKREGFDVVVVDASPEMLARAAAKGLTTVLADAQALPFADGTFDAAMLVSMLHHVDDPERAIREAQRVVRPGGVVVLKGWSREDLEHLWFADYWPSTREWMARTHPSLAELLALLPGARRVEIVFRDLEDASCAALAGRPDLVLDERWRRQTSYFERLERDHPDELRAGLERLRADVDAGRGPAGRGVASLLVWTAPPSSATSALQPNPRAASPRPERGS